MKVDPVWLVGLPVGFGGATAEEEVKNTFAMNGGLDEKREPRDGAPELFMHPSYFPVPPIKVRELVR